MNQTMLDVLMIASGLGLGYSIRLILQYLDRRHATRKVTDQ